MKQGSTIFARIVVYLIGLAALAVCIILLPELVREEAVGKSPNPYLGYSFLACAYALSIPFFVALYQAHKLLKYFEANKAFTPQSIMALRNIKICAMVFSVMITVAVIVGMSIARRMDPGEDVTFIATIGFIFVSVSSVIAVFVALLQKLLTDAVALKSENDLII